MADFDQIYASVVKPIAFKMLFTFVAFFDLDIDQMGMKIAFFYSLIDQLIYIDILKETEIEATRNMVCKLCKALYGLKQSSHIWYKRLLTFFFIKLGLTQIHADYSIFVLEAGIKSLVLSVFIDDNKIMTSKRIGMIKKVKQELTAAFSIVNMGLISFYLGLKVD